jgi:peptide/nickel transport system substrate-binding protein
MLLKNLVRRGMLFALIILSLFSACTSQAVTETPAAPATATAPVFKRSLRIWNPLSPTTLNPYLTFGSQDYEPSRITYEPLADFDKDGNLVPVLASEIPTLENGGLAADNKSVTWKLRRDVLWSDGKPFTAADVVFTYSYIIDPAVQSIAVSSYSQIDSVLQLDDYTIQVEFKAANPAWALPFVGIQGVILPEHIFESYKGTNAREAPANVVPVGTGPYRVRKPGIESQEVILLGSQIVKTVLITFEPNPYYRSPDAISFQKIFWNGGGDLNVANQQLFTEGSLDISYMIDSAQKPTKDGDILYVSRAGVERILINFTDPNMPSQDGEYSSLQVPHPFFKDKIFRQAVAYAIDRQALVNQAFVTGVPAYAVLVAPPQYLSQAVFYEYDPEKSSALLDEGGYVDVNGDGFREKDGVKITITFQSYLSPKSQAAQKIIRKNLNAIGIDVDLRVTDASIMFGADPSNPDGIAHFNSDLMMFATTSDSFDPTAFMDLWTCGQIPQQANNWSAGNNNERWCNPEYDLLLDKTKTELDPVTRQAMFVKLNDILIEDVAMIPLIQERDAMGVNKNLKGLDPTPWDALTWNIQDWYFVQP